ncbi:GNAT family N-acetyltransferase [Roseateles violae]|uniref:GNAT family N-acetyltransferase n=1 Tax=Roseateles violae TaxID=3058042 RepID=A0ABT8DNE3_9BURK|nr:GNAT family N-acetyltransferase [Pelomonas sp. PFR6]MDN3919657.1 GNAT family N-acetyltransferase [Pelomonas sp. PFR6]
MPARQPLRIEACDPCGAQALGLLHAAAREARALYPELFPDCDAPLPGNTPTPPRGCYLLALVGGEPLGCGAFRPVDAATAELRRIYVRPEARRGGIAQALLARLEAEALRLSYRRLVLETGYKQAAAMALYLRCGFAPIATFGDYIGDPSSRCFEKHLRP